MYYAFSQFVPVGCAYPLNNNIHKLYIHKISVFVQFTLHIVWVLPTAQTRSQSWLFKIIAPSVITKPLDKIQLSNHLKLSQNALKKHPKVLILKMAGTTRLELATSCVTGMRSNQTELRSHIILSSPSTSLIIICWIFFCKSFV